jgi:hypothetical protein
MLISCLLLSLSLVESSSRAQYKPSGSNVIGTVTSIEGGTIVVLADTGAPAAVRIQGGAKLLRVPPGQTTLVGATSIGLEDIQVGDRVLAVGTLITDSNSILTSLVVDMSQAAILQRQKQDWQQGVKGHIRSVDTVSGSVVIAIDGSQSTRYLTVNTDPHTVIRRYADNSVKFSDSEVSNLQRMTTGDVLFAHPALNSSEQRFVAQEIVFGTSPSAVLPQTNVASSQQASVTTQSNSEAVLQQSDFQDDSDRSEKISQLRADIESQEQIARSNEASADQVLNNCSGPGAALCQALGEAGAAKFRRRASEARNQADVDREEIERLQGEEAQSRQRRDTSYGGNLQQVAAENGTSIQNAARRSQSSGGPDSSPSQSTDAPVYNPNRHYTGDNSFWINLALTRNDGGRYSCPTSISQPSTPTGFLTQPANRCIRDQYIWSAILASWGAECESRLSRDEEASTDASTAVESLKNAAKLCSNAPVFATPGVDSSCGTDKIVTCKDLVPLGAPERR